MEKDSKVGEVPIKVKISGDGAKMTRLTNFIVISFSIINFEKAVMSSKGKSCKIVGYWKLLYTVASSIVRSGQIVTLTYLN